MADANAAFECEPFLPETIDLAAEGIMVLDGIEYAETEEGSLCLDILTDETIPGPKPAVLRIHCGGFTEEHITRKSRPEKRFLTLIKRGYVIVSIDYRLSQVHPFPSQIMDCKCAVRFIRKNAAAYGIDPDRIGVWGESCGGQLAALMAVREGIPAFEDKGGNTGVSSEVQTAVSWYGALDVMEFHRSRMAVDDIYPKRFEVMYGGKPEDMEEVLIASNPLTYADKATCSLLAMCSDGDPRVPYTVNFAWIRKPDTYRRESTNH